MLRPPGKPREASVGTPGRLDHHGEEGDASPSLLFAGGRSLSVQD